MRASQQRRIAPRHDGSIQRLVRSRTDVRARRHRAGRGREAAALDRLDSHLARSGRLHPLHHQVGRPADLAGRSGGIHGARQPDHAHCADCAGLRRARCRLPGAAARQGAGVARREALQPAQAVAAVQGSAGRSRRAAFRRKKAGDHVRPRLAQGGILAAADKTRGAARRRRRHRPQAGRDVPLRSPGALLSAVQRARQGRARTDVRGRRHPRARLDGPRRSAAAGQGAPARSTRKSSPARSTRRCIPAPTWNTSRCRPST